MISNCINNYDISIKLCQIIKSIKINTPIILYYKIIISKLVKNEVI